MHHVIRRGRRPLALLLLAALAACNGGGGSDSANQAEIRRTSMGVPHIKSDSWSGAGFGLGYAQAEDNLCTMADSFLTYRGERSRHFGGAALAVYDSTIERPRNIDSDFFHRHLLTDAVVNEARQAQSEDMRALMAGFAAGYNRYLQVLRAGSGNAHAACRNAAWVQPITEQDLWRRVYQAGLAGGYSNFLAAIANATPPAAATVAAAPAALHSAEIATPRMQVGGTSGIGSNMYGFGASVTGSDGPVLFGNPHWYWTGPDRFYQAQITIPGKLDVSGVSFLGIPVIQIGFNENVAWSHTVSTARRFGFFQLTLAPGDATSYLRDGTAVKMQATPITVDVRQDSGAVAPVTRTLYKTTLGPLVNLGLLNPQLAWSQNTAFVIRDINERNFRMLRNWLRWGQATSIDEFAAIQRQESAIPWVNTIAVGRGNNRAWYADIGTVPNVSAQQVATCTTPVGQAMAAVLPNTPFFDGARSACDWQSDADSVQPGAIGPARMPSLWREDYVGNMNDSYWLSNATAPLTGFPPIFGPTGTQAQSLRTRLGHTMALARLDGTDGYAGKQATSEIVRQMTLNSRVFSAERSKTQVLDLVCAQPQIVVTAESRTVDVTDACSVLRAWNDTGNPDARGSHVWDEFWTRIELSDGELYAVPFSAADPLNTPRDIQAGAADALRQAFGTAVLRVQQSGFALDAPRNQVLYSTRGGERVGLYGGCSEVGYFTITCAATSIEDGGYAMDGPAHGNSYMQVVNFPAGGAVQAYTFLTFSVSDDPASAHFGDYTRRYAAKQWLRVPFREADITADPAYTTVRVKE
ncbi:penicillin acylase family protein [Pseudorhodoferax sp.]|uniref:penicillin acylase family protein n=1 Tax=Pseudorhodoferax sp. TaxID=1993553 RepID=UPI002DD65A85|nr:penicillin acylase family protein [Pseudorhodoferax sp.]